MLYVLGCSRRKKMKNKVTQFALAAVLAAGFAAPALAQNTNWKLNSKNIPPAGSL
jgi:hypothetical protein